MPEINPSTIPGTVSIPTWVLIAAIVVLFGIREWERRKWFEKFDAATSAIRELTDAVKTLVGDA